ncbi:MAG: biotin/lipoyl-containing protein [Fibrobacterota bacterium]
MAKKIIKCMCTAFRDGFQSVYGARVLTQDFLPALEAARDAGITHFESGGGARFQSLYFYCNEDAFDMMDAFRETVGPDVNLQTLARGVNVVGLDSQPSDIIDLHAELFKKHGVTTIRNFDALNDIDNLNYSGNAIVNAGLSHQIAITLMELPPGLTGAHDPAYYTDVLKKILAADIPFDSVCFKDASGTLTAAKVYETIKQARKILPADMPVHYHTHETAGTSILAYKAAIDAGADRLDLSLDPVSGGTCQPDILTMAHALKGTDYELDVDVEKVLTAEEVFRDCMKDYFVPPEAKAVDPVIPWSPMPGGALTANTQMLRDNNMMDRFTDIIKNMGEVVKKGGYGTSVTPVSQFYFQQAFNNTLFGEWEKIADGYGRMVLGYFGKTPYKPDETVVKKASEQLGLERATKTVREFNDDDPSKGIPAAKKELEDAGVEITDENIFIAATCHEKGIAFLKGEAELNIRKNTAPAEKSDSGDYTVTVNNREYEVSIGKNGTATVDGKSYDTAVSDGFSQGRVSSAENTGSGDRHEITAPMPGKVFKVKVSQGDRVSEGDVIYVLEAMKMENDVRSDRSGTISSLNYDVGDQVNDGAVLAVIE